MRRRGIKLTALVIAAMLSMSALAGCSSSGEANPGSTASGSLGNIGGFFNNFSSQVSSAASTLVESNTENTSNTPESSVPVQQSSVAPVQSSVPVQQSSAAPRQSSVPVQQSNVAPRQTSSQSSAPQTTSKEQITIKEYFDQNGGDELLKQISAQNSNEQMNTNIYFANDNTLVFECTYTQVLNLDEDTIAQLQEYFDKNFEEMRPTLRSQFAPAATYNIAPFSLRVIVNNGDGKMIYQTDMEM